MNDNYYNLVMKKLGMNKPNSCFKFDIVVSFQCLILMFAILDETRIFISLWISWISVTNGSYERRPKKENSFENETKNGKKRYR